MFFRLEVFFEWPKKKPVRGEENKSGHKSTGPTMRQNRNNFQFSSLTQISVAGVPTSKRGHARTPSIGAGPTAAAVCIDMDSSPHQNTDKSPFLTKDGANNTFSDQNQIPAIQLINANKHYGSGKKKLPVLMGLDMEVER